MYNLKLCECHLKLLARQDMLTYDRKLTAQIEESKSKVFFMTSTSEQITEILYREKFDKMAKNPLNIFY